MQYIISTFLVITADLSKKRDIDFHILKFLCSLQKHILNSRILKKEDKRKEQIDALIRDRTEVN